MLYNANLYEEYNVEVTEQEVQVIKLIQQAYSDQSEATDIQSQEFSSQLQIQQNSLSYSSQKSMEKQILDYYYISRNCRKIDKDQQSITLNSINSINSVNKQIYYVLNQQRRMKYQRSLLISKQKGRLIQMISSPFSMEKTKNAITVGENGYSHFVVTIRS